MVIKLTFIFYSLFLYLIFKERSKFGNQLTFLSLKSQNVSKICIENLKTEIFGF